jgi:opacity protein-like surface antigen
MKRLILLSLVVFLCLPVAVYAASIGGVEDPYFKAGTWEVGFHGSYNHLNVEVDDESEKINFFYLDGAVSYFPINNFSIGVNTMWFYLPEIEDISAYAIGLEGNARYHFQMNQHFIPYIGAHVGGFFVNAEVEGESESEDANSYGFHAGFKIPINDNVYFDTQLKWTDYKLPLDETDLKTTQVLLGLGIKF